MREIGGHLRIILKEMCKRVGADFNNIDFNKEDWYWDYTWTEKEEEKFRKWLINYLTKYTNVRNEIMSFPTKNKEAIRKTAEWFMSDYGWKVKNNEKRKA